MQKKTDHLERKRPLLKVGVAVFSLAFIGAVAIIDYATQYETAVSLLYMVPIIAAIWFSWTPVAILAALSSGVSDSAVSYLLSRSYSPLNVLNSIIQSTFFIVFAFALIALKHSQGRLKQLSRSDALTDVANSRYFLEIGSTEIHRALRYKHPFSVIYMDIDDFKSVNDTLGHSSGDVLLCEIARRVKGVIRKTDTIARLGGDEFAVLMPETGTEAVKVAADRVRESLVGVKVGNNRPITLSMGVVTDNDRPCTFDRVLQQADALMYDVKRSGKDAIKYSLFVD